MSDAAGRQQQQRVPDLRAWWMVLRAFLSQNVAIGCTFGAVGVSVLPMQDRYDASRAEASMGLALVVLVAGLIGPAVANSIMRFGLRTTMTAGVVLSGAGYAVLAVAPSIEVVLLAFALLIGPGVALFGPHPSSMLAVGWMFDNRGRALGVTNMPLLVGLLPMIGLAIIDRLGLPAFFLCLAVLHLLLLPVVLGIANPPEHEHSPAALPTTESLPAISSKQLLARPSFWLVVLGGGLLNATGIIGVSHLVALGIEKGMAPEIATLMVSLMGVASVLGSIVVGLLCDRLGGARTLALAALGLAGGWAVILGTDWLPLIIPAALLIGACAAGVFPTINVLGAHLFGSPSLPRMVGLFGLFSLPFTFLLPSAAGAIRDATGDYTTVMLMIIVGCIIVAFGFFAAAQIGAHRDHMHRLSRAAAAKI